MVTIANSPKLHLDDCNNKFYLRTDAPNIGHGAAMMEEFLKKNIQSKFYQQEDIGNGK